MIHNKYSQVLYWNDKNSWKGSQTFSCLWVYIFPFSKYYLVISCLRWDKGYAFEPGHCRNSLFFIINRISLVVGFLYDRAYCISSNNTLPQKILAILIIPTILIILWNNFMLFLIRPAFEDHDKSHCYFTRLNPKIISPF